MHVAPRSRRTQRGTPSLGAFQIVFRWAGVRATRVIAEFFGTLRSNGYLLWQLSVRAFLSRNAGSVLGLLWPFLNTAVQLALYWVVFSKLIGIRLAQGSSVSFGLYLMVGLVPYIAASDALTRSTSLFRTNRTLIQRVRFPAEILVMGELTGTLLHHGMAFLVVVGVCVAMGTVGLSGLPWLFLGLGVLVLWLVGLSLLLAVAGALLPDIGEILGLTLLVVFYAAPIVYPMTMIGNHTLRTVIALNPLTQIVGLIRAGLLQMPPPGWWAVAILGGVGLLLAGAGVVAVAGIRRQLADLL